MGQTNKTIECLLQERTRRAQNRQTLIISYILILTSPLTADMGNRLPMHGRPRLIWDRKYVIYITNTSTYEYCNVCT